MMNLDTNTLDLTDMDSVQISPAQAVELVQAVSSAAVSARIVLIPDCGDYILYTNGPDSDTVFEILDS